ATALCRRVVAAVGHETSIRTLEGQWKKARDAEQRQQRARNAAAGILVTDEALERIHAVAKELEIVKGRLGAAATTIIFEMDGAALSGIEIDGKPLSPESPALRAVEATHIAIPGRGTITVEPAIKDRDKLLARRRDTAAKLEAALHEAGAASVEDAEQQCARRRDALKEAELAGQEAMLHAPATDGCEAGAQALADYIEGTRLLLVHEKAELRLPELPPRSEAQTALRTAEEKASRVRQAVQTARAELAGPEETAQRLAAELGGASARHDDARAKCDELLAKYRGAEETLPTSALETAVEVAHSALSAQQAGLSAFEAERTEETLPQLDARIGRLENAVRERSARLADVRVEISRLKFRIEDREGAGLDEEIEEKRRETELCERECEELGREVDTLELLLSTLRAAEREAKERYLSPVLRRVRPYLDAMFPGAQLTVDENLEIIGLVRDAGYEENFHRLSMGTQEQIAVLVRLAFAEMLAALGHPASIILDDALVFSDDRRMKLMFDILNMAARKVQIIILTCREQLFEGLGARRLTLKRAGSEELLSA
ncbi:MAG: ATP-binding protein, partial [Acetobacteraceae bacterium]